MDNLTKREIVIGISDELGLIQADVHQIVQKTLDRIIDALASGKNVQLRNFGVFEVRLTRPRVGRNPKSPEHEVQIPPRAIVKFKAGKTMKQRVMMRKDELKKPLAKKPAKAAKDPSPGDAGLPPPKKPRKQ